MVSLIYTEHAIIIVHLETAEIVGGNSLLSSTTLLPEMSDENGWK